ncbi:class I SAM-dependent methyltransferase [Sinomicrobium soli]|uniref:class I SAM-dependent methyltransferase n=1 Tax=Sinomicrobium sp. N-1-3-6 TaxID=2219864 RepID=UPI000DCBE2DC|nr:class I SAM-dependent methyltransferase [Sinomicrobium sp. N-1-3-6]RAV30752.1 class I SAM-dependent methyltransferase [Sinomicrobium sp. N-1-3-6]
MKKTLTETEIRELEKQLSCPSGKMGVAVGENMNMSNIGMTINTIGLLGLDDGNTVLELGHGNCGHLVELLGRASGLRYFGLEVSETMWNEARNAHMGKPAEFQLYDGVNIPFADRFFDRVMTVNTLYFWSDPEKLLQEIERTLKPGGIGVLTYADREFMRKLPFVGVRFRLFDKRDIEELIAVSELKITGFEDKTERVKSKTGDAVERKYTMVKIAKG